MVTGFSQEKPCKNLLILFVKGKVKFTPIPKIFQISREWNNLSLIRFLTKFTEEYFYKYLWSIDLLMISLSNIQQNLQYCFYWWLHNFANIWPSDSKIFWKHFFYTNGQLNIQIIKIKIFLKKCASLQKDASLQRFSVLQKMCLYWWYHYLATTWSVESNGI